MITYYLKTIKEPVLKTVPEFQIGAWIYVESPTEKEIGGLAAQFSLNSALLTDAIDPFEAPRLEVEDKITYVYTRVPFSGKEETRTVPLLVAVGETFLLTVASNPLPFLNRFFDEKIAFHTTQKTKLFLQLFLYLARSYESFLTSINKEVRSASVNLEQVAEKDILRFVRFESTLNDFLAALVPTNTILQSLLGGKALHLYDEDEDLVEDLMLQNKQSIELAKATSQTIGNIRNTYSTIVTNNLNDVIRLLTALTIIFTIPTTIASFFGMNIRLPLENSPYAFWIIGGFAIIISLTLAVIFVRNRWL